MRIVGIDLGARWIGVAAADDRMQVALPVKVVQAGAEPAETVAAIAEEERAGALVIGLPLSMSGATGPHAQAVLKIVETLRERLDMPVETWDERLTSVQANRTGSRSRSKRRGKAQTRREDSVAAAILLQAYLDSRRLANRR